MQLRRPARRGAGLGRRRRRHLGRRWPALGSRPRSTCTTSPRRSASPPTAGCGSRRARRPPSSGSSGSPRATAGARPRSTSASRSTNSRADQTYNTPAVATLIMLDDQIRWMNRQRRARVVRIAQRRVGRARCTRGPSRASGRRRSSPTRRSVRSVVAHDRPRPTTSRPTTCAPRCAPTASSTPTAIASSAATSCGSGCSRRSTPPTSRR